MARLSVSLVGVVVAVAALGVPAQAASSAPVPPRDSVVGGGHDLDRPVFNIDITAESDALGGNPTGTVSLTIATPPFGQFFPVVGRVTCLTVDHNRAVIGFVEGMFGIGPMTAVVSDNGLLGEPLPDGFTMFSGATDCSTVPAVPLSVLFGDVQIRDAPSKDQCRNGGWRSYADAAGQPFKSRGDCIAFALGAA